VRLDEGGAQPLDVHQVLPHALQALFVFFFFGRRAVGGGIAGGRGAVLGRARGCGDFSAVDSAGPAVLVPAVVLVRAVAAVTGVVVAIVV
jgi:hypothetical protein